ncbi:MAG: HoxN/HupN/NixA family nickel/cobalt transporter, partial [Casimicrobiaceae bacterium]
INVLGLRGGFFDVIANLDFGLLGYLIVGLFLVAWAVSVAVWKLGRIEERYRPAVVLHNHAHAHEPGGEHMHRHFH